MGWLLFLKIFDDQEQELQLLKDHYKSPIPAKFRWRKWAEDPEGMSALYGKVATTEFGLLVTLGTFTPPAINFAKSKSNLRLIDGEELVDLVFQHYDQFDSRYKGLLPLRRVYVPEAIDTDEG